MAATLTSMGVKNMSAGVMNQPAIVSEVFKIANIWLIVKKPGGRNVEATFATVKESSKGSSKTRWKSRGGSAGRKDNKPAAGYSESAKTKYKRELAQRIKETKCWICGKKGHWANECPQPGIFGTRFDRGRSKGKGWRERI